MLGYKLISTSFQSPKNAIKAKDSRLHQINVAVPGFLIGTPSKGTQQVLLPVQHIAKGKATSSNPTQEGEAAKVIEVVDTEEEFEVFDPLDPIESPGTTSRPLPPNQINSNQELADIPEVMVLQRKKDTSLLELLKSHIGGFAPEVVRDRAPGPPFL